MNGKMNRQNVHGVAVAVDMGTIPFRAAKMKKIVNTFIACCDSLMRVQRMFDTEETFWGR